MPEIKKFRKKPVVIEAYQTDMEIDILTLEGTMHASVGDWIITGVNGEKYPCKPDIFEKTYELANEQIDSGCSGQETVDCIKRSDALKAVCETCSEHGEEGESCASHCGDYALIQNIPAADVESVVRARWLPTKNFSGLKCSNCKARVKIGSYRTHNFCYKCGAKMDGEENCE